MRPSGRKGGLPGDKLGKGLDTEGTQMGQYLEQSLSNFLHE